MASWLHVLEAYLVQALLRSPTFHRGVEKVAKRVQQAKNGNFGKAPDEMGGTNVDREGPGFLQHFAEEVQTQLGRAESKQAANRLRSGEKTYTTTAKSRPSESGAVKSHKTGPSTSTEPGEQSGPKGGFLGEYVAALREQVRGSHKPR